MKPVNFYDRNNANVSVAIDASCLQYTLNRDQTVEINGICFTLSINISIEQQCTVAVCDIVFLREALSAIEKALKQHDACLQGRSCYFDIALDRKDYYRLTLCVPSLQYKEAYNLPVGEWAGYVSSQYTITIEYGEMLSALTSMRKRLRSLHRMLSRGGLCGPNPCLHVK